MWIQCKKQKYFQALFWCFSLSQVSDPSQYLEGPNSIWKDHEYWDPDGQKIFVHVSWSFQIQLDSPVCDKLKHQKWCLEVLFILECRLLHLIFKHGTLNQLSAYEDTANNKMAVLSRQIMECLHSYQQWQFCADTI